MKLDFSGLKVLVLGDPMLDIYHFGHVDRLSPEAPIPVFIEDKTDDRRGGADNVVHQLIALGVPVVVTGWSRGALRTVKHRYMVGNHQLFRHDTDICVPNRIPRLEGFHAIIISDYAKGAVTKEICSEAIGSGLPVIVDPKGKDWSKYAGCKLIIPNHLEVNGYDWPNMVVKEGAKGLTHQKVNYPSTAKHVFDVTGAGDTVTAVIGACIVKGWTVPEACRLANLAAGYVVGEVGTTVCPIEKLRELHK